MSWIVNQFDPSTLTKDTFLAPQSAGRGALVFWNESSHRLKISFQDGQELYVPAWYHRHKCGEVGNVNITWDILSTLASNFPPVSEVVVEAFASGENFPADGPISERQSNIGNAVGLATSSTSIANDGNVAGTSIVEATVSGDVSSAVSWTNDAKLINGDAAHPGFVKFDNNLINSDGSGNLTAHGLTAANFLVAQNTATVNNGLLFPNGAISQIIAGSLTSAGAHVISLPWNDITYRVMMTPNNSATGVYYVSAKLGTSVTLNVPTGGNCDYLIIRGT